MKYEIKKIHIYLGPAFDLDLKDSAWGINMGAELVGEGLVTQNIHAQEYTISRRFDVEKFVDIAESRAANAIQTTLRALRFTQQEIDEKMPDRVEIKEEIIKSIKFMEKRGL